MKYQPRYESYLQTTTTPTNWGFMEFISDMVNKYCESIGEEKDRFGTYHIRDHVAFTKYIHKEVSK